MSLLWKVPLATALVVMTLVLIYLCLINPAFFFVVVLLAALVIGVCVGGAGIRKAIEDEWNDD